MRRWIALILLCCAPLSAQQVSAAGRQVDLNYVTQQVTTLHPNFFYQLDRAVFQKAAADLTARIATASDAEFYVGLAQLIALADDAHTAIYLNGSSAQAIGFRTFPITLRWLDDGVFVTAASPAYARAMGAQITAIAGMPVDRVMEQMATIIPHGNDYWVRTMAEQYLTGQQILQGLHVAPLAAATTFTFRTLAGETFTLDLGPGSGTQTATPDPRTGSTPDYLVNPNTNYWYSYSAENRLMYFKYNRCVDDPANPFAGVAAEVLRIMDSKPVDTFVLDFRGNGGGSDSVWGPLLEGLSTRIVGLLGNPQFRMYGLIDKGTFSAAMDNAMSLKQPLPPELTSILTPDQLARVAVTLAGEPTGGKPKEYGNVQPFVLAGSKLVGQYSQLYFPNPDYIPDLPSLMPDVRVEYRSTDYFARHDPVMAAVLAGAKAPVPTGAAKVTEVVTVNGASYRGTGVAPGSLAIAFGAFGKVPDEVLVGGVKAQVAAAASTQVNFIVPAGAKVGVVAVVMRSGGTEIASGTADIAPAAPGVFILNPGDPAQPGAVENQDYAVNGAAAQAEAGSVIQIFATGLDAGTARVWVAGLPAKVLFNGNVGPGLWQVNAVVPPGLSGQVPVFLVSGGVASNGTTIYVK